MAATDIETVGVIARNRALVVVEASEISLVSRALAALMAGFAASRELGHDDLPRVRCASEKAAGELQARFFP